MPIRGASNNRARVAEAAALTAAAMVDAGSYQTALEVRAAEVHQARATPDPGARGRWWL